MSDAFTPPPGDGGGLAAAARSLQTLAAQLAADEKTAQGAVATALSEWHAPRTADFRDAGAGMQAQLVMMATAMSRVSQAVGSYGTAVDRACQDVAGFKRQADPLLKDPTTNAAKIAHLEEQARLAKSDLTTLAGKLAAAIDMETDMAVPQSASLTPAQIRRRVDSSLGVAGIQAAAADGSLSTAQAWDALTAAQKAVPKDAVNDDGSVDWKKAVAEFNDKYLGPPNAAGGVAVVPSEGWALSRLLLNQREVAATANDLRTAFDEIVGPVGLDLDRGLAGLSDINDALIRFKAVDDAFSALGPSAETADAVEKAAAGGLPETGVIGALGKFAAGLAVIGDVLTLVDPGVKNPVEAGALRGAAGLNIAGTGMAFAGTLGPLVGINAVADWIPVAGEVVMIGTGLFLAGDYVYHHWDEIKHGLSTAYDATTHALGTAYHATTHALGTAASATGHALSSAGNAIGDAFSSVF